MYLIHIKEQSTYSKKYFEADCRIATRCRWSLILSKTCASAYCTKTLSKNITLYSRHLDTCIQTYAFTYLLT